MLSLQRKITYFAIASRICVVIFSSLCNHLIPDHDAGVFKIPVDMSVTKSFGDNGVEFLLGGLVRWDAHYFVHIAMYGYTYENCLAFFPLYPMSVRIVAGLLYYPLNSFLNQYSLLVVSAVLINIICFVKSANVLYELGLKVLNNKILAYNATILFCINPASIFFTAPYSEAMFAYFSFYGMLMCANGRLFLSGLPFGLSAGARSNGILNLGFMIHQRLRLLFSECLPKVWVQSHSRVKSFVALGFAMLETLVPLAISVLIALLPFVGFQIYGYSKFCVATDHNLPDFLVAYAQSYKLVLPGLNVGVNDSTHWCNAAVPLAYSFVQSHYWDVGFLQYYRWKQIPNFLLAIPIVYIILTQSYQFMRLHSETCLTLGLINITEEKENSKRKQKSKGSRDTVCGLNPEVFVFIVHAAFLTVFCVFCIHVQVTTRMIASASPALYWFAASYFPIAQAKTGASNITSHFSKISSPESIGQYDTQVESVDNLYSLWKVNLFTQPLPSREAKYVTHYFLLYFILGIFLFSNFLPWT